MRLPILVSLPIIIFSTNATQAETIQTRAPQAHVDAFMASCKGRNVPTASCSCMLAKLSATRAGDAAMDAIGMLEAVKDEAGRKAAMTPLLNRHGMRASELQAALDPNGATIKAVTQQCE